MDKLLVESNLFAMPIQWYLKLLVGVASGFTVATVRQGSNDQCFNNALSLSDSVTDYALNLGPRNSWDDYWVWLPLTLVLLVKNIYFTIYWCAGSDPNIGWEVNPVYIPNTTFGNAMDPDLQDTILSIIPIAFALMTVLGRWDTQEIYYVAKKFTQAVSMTGFYFAKYLV